RRRHTSFSRDWSSDVCSSDLVNPVVVNMEIHLAQGSRDGLGGTDAERHLRGVGRVLAAAVQFDDLAGIGAGGDQLIRLVLVVLRSEARRVGKACMSGRRPARA